MASATQNSDEKGAAGGGGGVGPNTPSAKGSKPHDLDLGTDDAGKSPDVPGSAAGKGAAQAYRQRESALKARTSGYFMIYKSGQGYWTRMGTAAGAALLAVLLAYTLYDKIPTFFTENVALGHKAGIGVAAGFLIAFSIVAWSMMNKPANVDFLIATDSEMKKVNWTSRKELIGSTKVVIVFMILIALFLFLVDVIFSKLMYWIHVLQIDPIFGGSH